MKPQPKYLKTSRFVLALACSLFPLSAWPATADLLKTSREVRQFMIDGTGLTPENCGEKLTAIVQRVEAFRSKDLERKNLKAASGEIIQNFWDSRLALRKKMIQFHKDGNLPAACVSGIRNTFTALRFMEEYTGIHALPAKAWLDPVPQKVFSGGFPMMMNTPEFKDFKFKSGDVLVSYGMAYGSAAISHVGDDGGTFSHLAMVHVTPDGQVWTIEAHPEFGVKVALIDKYLVDGKGRSSLYRHPDTELAAAAGKAIYDVAYKQDRIGQPIPYDFTMNLKDHTALFCTETASYAFEMAEEKLGRHVETPMYPTLISLKNPYILNAFAIKERQTFAPSDMEVDPQFEMLAEWRDIPRARLMHHQQAALAMEFKWLDDLNYSYRDDLLTLLQGGILYSARRLPLFSGLVDDLIPPNLTKKALQAVVNVYVTSDMILELLIARDQKFEKKAKATLMTSKEILDNLEDLRQEDLAAYRAYQMERLYPTGGEGGNQLPTNQFSWHLRAVDEP